MDRQTVPPADADPMADFDARETDETQPRRDYPLRPARLAPMLYFVSTPIGSARDITLRALDILAVADVLAAEDTRTARRLMEIHGIALGDRPLVAYHDHNAKAQRPRLLAALEAGKSVAYMSEAGTPLVADPGYALGRAAIDAGHAVTAAPGASAVLSALTVSGLPSDKFLFAGFPPPQASARAAFLKDLAAQQATVVLYESPKRLGKLLDALICAMGGDRRGVICRELTKRFEEIRRGSLSDLAAALPEMTLKGEIVVLIDRAAPARAGEEEISRALLRQMLSESTKDAVNTVSVMLGVPRRQVYQIALSLKATEHPKETGQ